jgi:hypothetical protein
MNWSTAAGGNGPSRDLYATSVNRSDQSRRQRLGRRGRAERAVKAGARARGAPDPAPRSGAA